MYEGSTCVWQRCRHANEGVNGGGLVKRWPAANTRRECQLVAPWKLSRRGSKVIHLMADAVTVH
jgi:hypothetical protein